MSIAVGPRPELLQDPCELPRRGIAQAIAQGLRACTMLLGISRVPIIVVLHPGDRGLLFFSVTVCSRRIWQRDRHVQVDADTVGGILNPDAGRDHRTPIAALSRVALVSQPGHQLRPCAPHPLHVPSGARRFVRKAVARKRRTYEVKRIGGIATMSSRISQRFDHFLKFHDRTRPAMSHDQRYSVGMRRTNVDKMYPESVDVG